jgi:hypothetical protein
MGNSVVQPAAVVPGHICISRSVHKLGRRLDVSSDILAANRIRMPSGGDLYLPRFRWCLLVKAIVEQFCPAFTPGGLVLYIRDTENRFVHLDVAGLSSLGISLDASAKVPDVIVHDVKRNWLRLIEAVTSAGSVDGNRRKELKELFAGSTAGLVFVTAFETRRTMQSFVSLIAWGSEVWIAEDPGVLPQMKCPI